MFQAPAGADSNSVDCCGAGILFVHTCYLAIRPGWIAGPEADAEVIELVRKQLGLDQPLHVQFWH